MKNLTSQQTFIHHTNTRLSAGTPTTLGIATAVVEKVGTGTNTTTGLALTTDLGGVVGLLQMTVTTTDAWYATGYDYNVRMTSGTIDGQPIIGAVIGEFGIENEKSDAVAIAALPTVAATPASVAALQVSVNALPTVVATPASIAEIISAISALPTVAATPASVQAIKVLVDALPTVAMTPDSGAQIITAVAAISTITWLPNAAQDLHSSWLNSEEILTDTGTTLPGVIAAIPTTSTGLSTTQDATLTQILVDTSTNIPADIAGITVSLSTTDIASMATQTAAAIAGGGDTLYSDTVVVGATPQVNAKVCIFNNLTDTKPFAVAYTDTTGTFRFMLNAGTYPIVISSDGEVTKTTSITVT